MAVQVWILGLIVTSNLSEREKVDNERMILNQIYLCHFYAVCFVGRFKPGAKRKTLYNALQVASFYLDLDLNALG